MSNQCIVDRSPFHLSGRQLSKSGFNIFGSGVVRIFLPSSTIDPPKKNELTREIERHDFRRDRVVRRRRRRRRRRRQRLEEGGRQSFERCGVVEPTVQAQYLPRAAEAAAAARRRTVDVDDVVVVDVEIRPVPRRELHPVGARVGPLRHCYAAADYDVHAPGGCYRGQRNRSSEHDM